MPEPVTAAPVVPPNGVPAGTPQVPEPAPAAAKPPEPVVPDPEKERMGQRFAQIARATQQLAREKQAAARERQTADAALKLREDALAAKAAQFDEWQKSQASALQDPGQHMRRLYGENWYDRLTQYKLEGEKSAPADLQIQAAREEANARIDRIEKENRERWEKAEAERKAHLDAEKTRAASEEKALLDQFRADAVDYVNANAEKYELITLNEAHGLVHQAIEETAKQTTQRDENGRIVRPGRVMSFEEAADLVEKHLEALEEKKLSASKKLQAKGWAKAPPVKPPEPASDAARTLTNTMGTAAGGSSSRTAEDRIARAAAAMEAAYASAPKT